MIKQLRIVTILLISLMLVPTVSSVAYSKLSEVVTVGSIDPSLGYDEIVNGTTTFIVARKPEIIKRGGFHNITKYERKLVRVEVSSDIPGAYFDDLTGKYYILNMTCQSYDLTVPDPNGTVTVFSNMVFKGTGSNPKSKVIIHPDCISQSILHVKGQADGDPYCRRLIITIYNSYYPNGYVIDNTVVQSSFDFSYDVTNIVARWWQYPVYNLNNISIVLTTYVGQWNVQCYFWVSTPGADVYIIKIPDIPAHYVSDMDAVTRGVEEACSIMPFVHSDFSDIPHLGYYEIPWKHLTYLEITDINTYRYIIEHPDYVKPIYSISGDMIVVVNAHGEVIPVPPGYSWDSWVDQISLVVQTKGVIWVQVAGYPFYYYSQGSYSKTEIGSSGFQRFLQRILGPNNIDCWPIQEGRAVPLLGGYSNRLWGYGLINGGLHEGRPLKISSSTNLADLLDVMGNWTGDTLCLTLGLIGFASPNQNVDASSDQRTGYYVHNGAQWYDSDYNKGKYSMAVAAWPKVSNLASGSSDIYYSYGPSTWWMGTLKCQVAWSRAEPPPSSSDPWKVTFVTLTTALVRYYPAPGPGTLTKANSPLKLTSSTSNVTFGFNDARSTKLLDPSENNWQNTIRSEILSTAISILLIPFTGGWTTTQKILLTVAIKFASQILKLPFQSPQPVTSGPYIDLAMEDLSDVVMNIDGYRYKQLEAIGVIDAYIPQSQIATPIPLNFLMGQRCAYLIASGDGYWCEKSINLNFKIKIEPRTSGDCNQAPQTPKLLKAQIQDSDTPHIVIQPALLTLKATT